MLILISFLLYFFFGHLIMIQNSLCCFLIGLSLVDFSLTSIFYFTTLLKIDKLDFICLDPFQNKCSLLFMLQTFTICNSGVRIQGSTRVCDPLLSWVSPGFYSKLHPAVEDFTFTVDDIPTGGAANLRRLIMALSPRSGRYVRNKI